MLHSLVRVSRRVGCDRPWAQRLQRGRCRPPGGAQTASRDTVEQSLTRRSTPPGATRPSPRERPALPREWSRSPRSTPLAFAPAISSVAAAKGQQRPPTSRLTAVDTTDAGSSNAGMRKNAPHTTAHASHALERATRRIAVCDHVILNPHGAATLAFASLLTVSRSLGLSFQSAFHLSLTVLVRYRSRAII